VGYVCHPVQFAEKFLVASLVAPPPQNKIYSKNFVGGRRVYPTYISLFFLRIMDNDKKL